jgi:transcriptional regulator with XRE-family HTH domain
MLFLVLFMLMSFKENLKTELGYSGMLVKELAARSGVKKHTIDNYLNTHNSIPLADAAVSIARALGVSVEYLITGQGPDAPRLSPEARSIVQIVEGLSEKERRLALALVKVLQERTGEDRV